MHTQGRRVAQAGGLCSALHAKNLEGVVKQFREVVKSNQCGLRFVLSLRHADPSLRRRDFRQSAIIIDLFPSKHMRSIKKDDMAFIGRTSVRSSLSPFPRRTLTRPQIHGVNVLLQYTSPNHDAMAKTEAHALAHSFFKLDQKPDSLTDVPRYPGYTCEVTGFEAFMENYHRVRKVKSSVDPKNAFNKWCVLAERALCEEEC